MQKFDVKILPRKIRLALVVLELCQLLGPVLVTYGVCKHMGTLEFYTFFLPGMMVIIFSVTKYPDLIAEAMKWAATYAINKDETNR